MTISAGDIKLVASQVMDDVSEGGGAPTATVIADGTSNSIFNDISELDRAGGRVNLRKIFAHVQTPNTDGYLGANVILADAPDDPLVDIAIFKTGSTFDVRDDARNRIEAYLNKGATWDGFLWENHITGQRSVSLFQRTTAKLPTVGKTLCLVVNENTGTEYFQYVRITRVDVEPRTFSYTVNNAVLDYSANIVTCEISDTLRYDFPGSVATPLFVSGAGKTITRDTIVADAAKYYGAATLTDAVAIGDVSASVSSIYTQIVPSAQTETALVDVDAGGTAESVIVAATTDAIYTTSAAFAPGATIYLGNPIAPGSLSIAVTGGTLHDDAGRLMSSTTVIGAVDYARGTLTFAAASPTFSGSKTVSFKPSGAPVQVADTAGIRVEIESRRYSYNLTIVPAPAPGTCSVSFMAQGNWYDLRDNGGGKLVGADPSFGTGTVSYTTGTVSVTLGALPDVGSEIIYFWGSAANYLNRSGATFNPAVKTTLQLSHTGITPNTLTLTWNDGTARTADDDGKGVISGDATGTVNYQTGLVEIYRTTLPAGGQSYTAAYSYGPPITQEFANPARNGDTSVTLTLGDTDITPGSVELTYNLDLMLAGNFNYVGSPALQTKILRDDGLGALRDGNNVSFGSINYATGVAILFPDTTVPVPMVVNDVVSMGSVGGISHIGGGA